MIGSYTLAEDAKPQVKLLLIATVITLVLWFLPYAEYLTYPIRLFVTLMHEAGHAIAAVATGGSVQNLVVNSDGSGSVFSYSSSWFGRLATSSAGYLGTTVFGVLLLVLIRLNFTPGRVLAGLGIFAGLITIVFGLVSPVLNILFFTTDLYDVIFTTIVGMLLSASLIVGGIFLNRKWASFAVAFLSIQLILNALSDLKTVFFMNAPLVGTGGHNDALNMADITGIPAIVWVVIWIAISIVTISLGLRLYAVRGRSNSTTTDLLN